MKRNSLFKYIFISSLATLSIFASACGKKPQMSAQQINESIAQANKEKAEAEEKAIAESKAQQEAEDQEKFHVKSEEEKRQK